MRKLSLLLLVALLAITLGLGAVACGSGDTASGKTPEEAVTAAFESLETAGSQSGTYLIALTVDADASDADMMTQALLGQPIQITGEFASQQDPIRADLSLGLNLMGFDITAGVRAIDEDVWVNVLGQWYKVPAEDLGTSGVSIDPDLMTDFEQAIEEQGLDTNTWYTGLTVVGEETLNGATVSHLSATVDVQKILTDMIALLQSPALAEIMGDATGAVSESGLSVPDSSETDEIKAMVDELIESATFDLWIAEDDSLRKAVFAVDVIIPEEMGGAGINGANVTVTVNLNAPGQTVEVSAPASVKPLSELENDMENNPLLAGFGSLLSSGGGLEDILGQ